MSLRELPTFPTIKLRGSASPREIKILSHKERKGRKEIKRRFESDCGTVGASGNKIKSFALFASFAAKIFYGNVNGEALTFSLRGGIMNNSPVPGVPARVMKPI